MLKGDVFYTSPFVVFEPFLFGLGDELKVGNAFGLIRDIFGIFAICLE